MKVNRIVFIFLVSSSFYMLTPVEINELSKILTSFFNQTVQPSLGITTSMSLCGKELFFISVLVRKQTA